ncbi:MAG: beta-N-acetylhexosaminidase [Cyclobacteriaceae bacterium]|nr:beta-N-acetylhexosaminidase [Cyclobacteriaceae bacterium]
MKSPVAVVVNLFFFGLFFIITPARAQSPVPLIPLPQEYKISDCNLKLPAQISFKSIHHDSVLISSLYTIYDDLRELGFFISEVGATSNQKPAKPLTVFLTPADGPELGNEGYEIIIDKDITILAHSHLGFYWACNTLLQLFGLGPGSDIPCMSIRDWPDFSYRGLMIDVARQFHTVDFHLDMIKAVSRFKLNHYMIHFSANQSFTLPSDKFPNLPTPDRHYSKADLKKIMDAAKKHNITFIPLITVPGHSAALIEGIPELRFDEQGRRINIASDKSYEVLEELFSEWMDIFTGPYWHLGADEVNYPDLDESPNDAYSNWMRRHNLESGDQLKNYFINRMYEFIRSKGYKMMVWEGFKPDIHPQVHKEIIVCPFDIKFQGIMPNDYFTSGYSMLNTAWTPLYIANKIYMTTPEVMALWNPFMFGAGRSPQPFNYWKKYDAATWRNQIIGAQMCVWDIEEKAQKGLLLGNQYGPGFHDYGRPGARLRIFSEKVWNGAGASPKDLLERAGESYWTHDQH